ncbi:MAG: hypothetical protein Q4E53_13935 [Eubacteriales bacterium]|nr:hypothetical protein [Eubacteriales bacterium]
MCKALNWIKKQIKSKEGAVVVEMAMIVPIIWIVIMWIILLLFFFQDMGVMKSEAIRVANDVASEWRKEKHKTVEEHKKIYQNRLKERLILSRIKNVKLTVSGGKVIAEAEISFGLAGTGLTFSNHIKVPIDDREKWVRLLQHG